MFLTGPTEVLSKSNLRYVEKTLIKMGIYLKEQMQKLIKLKTEPMAEIFINLILS